VAISVLNPYNVLRIALRTDKYSYQFSSLSPRRERARVRGMMSPPPLSSPLKGGGDKNS